MNIFSKLYTGGRLKAGYTSGRVKADLELGKPGPGGSGRAGEGVQNGGHRRSSKGAEAVKRGGPNPPKTEASVPGPSVYAVVFGRPRSDVVSSDDMLLVTTQHLVSGL